MKKWLFLLLLVAGCTQKPVVPPSTPITIASDQSTRYRDPIVTNKILFHNADTLNKPGSVVGRLTGYYRGYYSFTVTSTIEQYDVVGRQQLVKYKHEFEIIRQLQDKTASSHFWDGSAEVAKNVYHGLVELFYSPAVTGGNIYSASGKLVRKLNDPNGINDIFSDSPEKRQLAKLLGLDVYSYNPEVQEFLHKAAKNYSRGKIFGKALTWLIPASPLSVMVSIGGINADSESFLENRSPEEVVRYSREQLLSIGCAPELVELAIGNQYLNPRSLIYITRYIEQLKGVNGAGRIPLEYVVAANSKDRLDTVYLQLEMFAELHRSQKLTELFSCGNIMGIRLEKDRVPMVIVPYDYLELNRENRKVISLLIDKSTSKRAIWCAGTIDNDVKQLLNKEKIAVREQYIGF